MGKRLSKIPWLDIKHDFIANNLTQRDLAKKYGLNDAAIARRCSQEGWVEQRRRYRVDLERETLQNSLKVTSELKAKVNTQHVEIAQKVLAKVDELLEGVEDIDTLRRASVAMSNLASALEKIQTVQRKALNLDSSTDEAVDVTPYIKALSEQIPEIWTEADEP